MSLAPPQAPPERSDLVRVGQVPPSTPPAALAGENRFGRPMPADRLRSWVLTLTLTLIGGVLRLQNLGTPTDGGTPVFDEKHYVPQAWQMLRNGGYEDNPGYELTVHPPLGKQLIAIGEWLFGYDGWGWRFTSAVAGTIMVLLVIRVARRLTRSTLLGGVAGVLLICDGLSHLQSRTGMLDNFLALFVLAAFACLIADRDQMRERLSVALAEGWATASKFGPRVGFRWWRFGTGVCLGLACGVKWSGVYWVAAFGVLSVVWDLTARRTAGISRPLLGTAWRDLPPALWSLAVVPVLTYLSTWWSWFAAETTVDRHAGDPGSGGFSLIPDAVRALLYYSGNVLDFHAGLDTPADPHPWESKPWSWPMALRPMLYYYAAGSEVTGCGESQCVRATMLIGTPAMWWLALPVLGWAAWRALARLDWRFAAVGLGYLAGFLPWFTNLDRQMYLFYMTPVAPFLVLGLVLILGAIMGRWRAGRERRHTGILVLSLYVGLVVANFAWLWPILNALPITQDHWEAQLWLPSWR